MSSRSPSPERDHHKRSHKHKKRRNRSRSESPRPRQNRDQSPKSFGKWDSEGEDDQRRRHKKHRKHHHSPDSEGYGDRRARDNRHGVRVKQERDRDGSSSFERSRAGRNQRDERDRNDDRRRENFHRRGGHRGRDADGDEEFGRPDSDNSKKEEVKDKDKPNFELSGKLTEDTNTFRGVVIKYSEPPEARKTKKRWRLYPFKGDTALPVLHIHRQSAYLIGRDRLVVDLPIDHPSCSKQHAALQYRLVEYDRPDGRVGRQVRPYVIDLESANGTFVNNQKIDPKRYVELREKDVIKFGFSSREYVLLHDKVDISEIEEDDEEEGTP